MDISELGELEHKWLKKQRRVAKNRDTVYEQNGVYAAWRDIFHKYVLLAKKRDIEAMKRALYLAWAECSQGPLLSGIKGLDPKAIHGLFATVNKRVQDGSLDAELRWMLPYYYFVEPAYLDRFDDLDELREFSRREPLLYRKACLESSFNNRGHMGDYWQSKQAILRQWP